MELNENNYAYWLSNVPGVGSASAIKLMEQGISCKEIFEMSGKELSRLLPAKKVKNVEWARKSWDFEKEEKKLRELGIRFIPMMDEEFPEKLRNIDNAPFGIYVKGRLPDPEVPSVAIIGARMCSEYGRYMARQFGQGLAVSGVQVISGMARGVDGISQNAALDAGGKSFGVLGCGADVCYPEENREVYQKLLENGGIISEYPPGTQPLANFFPMRNRIISALADVVLVVEARQKSGTQITVDTALEQGREVLAIPGRVTDRLSDGCNYLISQGAGIAISVEDVLDRLWKIKNVSAYSGLSCGKSKEEKSDQATEHKAEGRKAVDSEHKTEGKETADSENKTEGSETVDSEHRIEKAPAQERTLDEEILDIIDIIPISMSSIMEELYRRGRNITIPTLMTELMDMTGSGKILQNGAYYRKLGTMPNRSDRHKAV